MRVVCDTNVILSAIIFGGNPEKILTAAREKKIMIYISIPLLLEVAKKLNEKFTWEREKIITTVTYLNAICTVVKPKVRIDLIKDEADNRVLECSLTAEVNYIVSGDRRHLLPLKKFRQIIIISPADFVSLVLFK